MECSIKGMQLEEDTVFKCRDKHM